MKKVSGLPTDSSNSDVQECRSHTKIGTFLSGRKSMQDKTFLQAIQDLQGRLSNSFQDTIYQMLVHRATVSRATADIPNDKERTLISRTLIVGQIIALLTLMKEMQIINETQHNEFKVYLMHTLSDYPYED
jgi:hypothetical protein